ncbi:HTH-type transcriptional repressor FabR [Reinekea marina]|uniref:HTH-type transcriptional repressor FabR n=1 Tax=Reinekea marina TaxID=1310421 RepID=A0ABV7WVF0_9GAMM
MNIVQSQEKRTAGRKATITRDDIIAAAMRLVGPNRSVSSLSLREITREAGIAPNSFYRHFDNTEALAISAIELAGSTLRTLIKEARFRTSEMNKGIVRMSVETFIHQLYSDGQYLPLLLREGIVGSDRFKKAVRKQLAYFEQELADDLQAIALKTGKVPHRPDLVATAITRLVFSMGADALDTSVEHHQTLIDDMVTTIKIIITGAHVIEHNKELLK